MYTIQHGLVDIPLSKYKELLNILYMQHCPNTYISRLPQLLRWHRYLENQSLRTAPRVSDPAERVAETWADTEVCVKVV